MDESNGRLLHRAFQSLALPPYVTPALRSPMGQHNDRLYELAQSLLQGELESLAQEGGLALALRALYEQQVDIGFIQDDFSQVSNFRYRAQVDQEDRAFIVQYNPRRAERHKGAGRATPPPGAITTRISDPTCFLCTDNIRWQHRGIQSYYRFFLNGRPYNALCNPFPFMHLHLTIAAGEHIPQSFQIPGDQEASQSKICRIVEDLYALCQQLPTFVGFYNGVGAGATIERHLHYHFFAIPDGHGAFPIQQAARRTEREAQSRSLDQHSGTKLRLQGYPLTAFRLRGTQDQVVEQVSRLATEWGRLAGEAASANIVTVWEDEAVSMYFVPRNRLYTRSPGLAGTVAGLEVLGEFIFVTEGEYQAINEQRVTYDYLWRILEAVRPQESILLD